MASSRMPVTSFSASSGPAMDEHLLHDWSALVQASLSCFLQERLACAICERLTRDTRLAKIFQGCSCLRCHESSAFLHEMRSKTHTAVFVNGRPGRRDARVSTSSTSFTVRAFLIPTWLCRTLGASNPFLHPFAARPTSVCTERSCVTGPKTWLIQHSLTPRRALLVALNACIPLHPAAGSPQWRAFSESTISESRDPNPMHPTQRKCHSDRRR